MSYSRRTFLIGAGSGLAALVLTACTTPETPDPTPTPTASPTGDPVTGVPRPAGIRRSAWGSDSFSRGSVSYLAVGATLEHRDALRQPLVDRVFFAGEATSTEHAGTVLGARETGSRAASDLAIVGEPSERVAVVGAGAAGAEAARALTSRGYEVTVIEARQRVGGRIETVRDDDWPVTVELGAWRLLPTADADLVDALDRVGVATETIPLVEGADDGDTTAALYRSPSGEALSDAVGAAAVASALEWARQQPRDTDLETALDESGAADSAAGQEGGELAGADLLAQQLATLAATYGADAAALSGWYTTQPTEAPVVVTGGFDTLVTDALDGIETFLSTTVVGVSYTDDGVSLRLGTGESLAVDRVIVTVPLGVLQDDSIEFDPLLPFSHRAAITSLGMGTVDTVWLRFDEPFWSTDAVVWNLVGTDFEVTTWYNLQPITGEAVLVGIVGGDAALELEQLDDDELTDRLVATLAPFAA